MIEFLGSDFFSNFTLIQDRYYVVSRDAREGKPADELPINDKKHLAHIVQSFGDHCRAIGLEQSALQATVVHQHVAYQGELCNNSSVASDLEALITLVVSELSKQRFAYIPLDSHKYFEQENLFLLNQPITQFPSADQDIRDAGNAYAVGLYTATVFHLMRVAEIGLRVFAKHLRVGMPKKKGPIQWAQWEDILRELRLKIDKLSTRAGAKPKKSADRAFYRGLLTEFEGFKDMYRNDVMHVRKTYSQGEATSALERVGEFIQRLGTRVHE